MPGSSPGMTSWVWCGRSPSTFSAVVPRESQLAGRINRLDGRQKRRSCPRTGVDHVPGLNIKLGDDGGVRGRANAFYAAFAFFAFWIARHTRSGVSGMLISVMPYSDSASTTALTMHTRLPAQPASPQPLVPSGFDFAGEG